MFKRISDLYNAGSLTLDGVKRAVEYGWITAEEYELITGEEYAHA